MTLLLLIFWAWSDGQLLEVVASAKVPKLKQNGSSVCASVNAYNFGPRGTSRSFSPQIVTISRSLISQVQGHKAAPPDIYQRKQRFFADPVSQSAFRCLQDQSGNVLRSDWFFSVFHELLGTSKTCVSGQYMLQKSCFPGCSCLRLFSVTPLKCVDTSGGVLTGFLAPFWVRFLACWLRSVARKFGFV